MRAGTVEQGLWSSASTAVPALRPCCGDGGGSSGEGTFIINSWLRQVMVLMLPCSQKGSAELWNPISMCWKTLQQDSDSLACLPPSQATIIRVPCVLQFLSDFRWQ